MKTQKMNNLLSSVGNEWYCFKQKVYTWPIYWLILYYLTRQGKPKGTANVNITFGTYLAVVAINNFGGRF